MKVSLTLAWCAGSKTNLPAAGVFRASPVEMGRAPGPCKTLSHCCLARVSVWRGQLALRDADGDGRRGGSRRKGEHGPPRFSLGGIKTMRTLAIQVCQQFHLREPPHVYYLCPQTCPVPAVFLWRLYAVPCFHLKLIKGQAPLRRDVATPRTDFSNIQMRGEKTSTFVGRPSPLLGGVRTWPYFGSPGHLKLPVRNGNVPIGSLACVFQSISSSPRTEALLRCFNTQHLCLLVCV